MAITYTDTGRESIPVTNVTNEAVEVFDGQDAIRFAPNETKVLAGAVALRVQALKTTHLSLPDQGTTGNIVWPEHPTGNNKTDKPV